jgi:hypothetical protein
MTWENNFEKSGEIPAHIDYGQRSSNISSPEHIPRHVVISPERIATTIMVIISQMIWHRYITKNSGVISAVVT